jgi:hypothetical protein
MDCPARYRYEVIEGLHGSRYESPYMQFHRCVYMTVQWLEEQRESGQSLDDAAALAQLTVHWSEKGPVGDAFEAFYRQAADSMIRGMTAAIATEAGQYARPLWAVPVGGRLVTIMADRVVLTADGAVHVQRIRTGRETQSEAGKPVYSLLRRGAEAHYPDKSVIVETFYLATGKRVLVPPDDDEASLAKYADAIANIERGNFEPSPSPRACPKCQCYFICRG